MKKLPFHLHDITDREIKAVTRVLRSSWINTGPETAAFEKELAAFLGAKHVVALNSATAGLYLALKIFGIGLGDEVITTPLTYAATANVIVHCGATPVFADIGPDQNIDPEAIARKVTTRTKGVIGVDYGGLPCDHRGIISLLKKRSSRFYPSSAMQKRLGRILYLADCAHSIGSQAGHKSSVPDISVYSFHAVKNITTSDGGAVSFNNVPGIRSEELEKQFRLYSLHGQDKSAFAKLQAGSWQYDIPLPGFKFNMTDLNAAVGRVQLKREGQIRKKKEALVEMYDKAFSGDPRLELRQYSDKKSRNAHHLYTVLLCKDLKRYRDEVIAKMAKRGIALNVHYRLVTEMSYYRKKGFKGADTPVAYDVSRRTISLPLYSKLCASDAKSVVKELVSVLNQLPD